MDSIILSSAYLGPVEYYSKLYHYKKILIEAKENYIKQTYRNRCFIGAANDIQSLSIPVESSGGMKRGIKDIRVSDHANWRHQHWYAIKSTYNSTPFFEFYEDDFAPFFEKKYDFLFDLNEELRILICELLGMETEVGYTEEFILPEKISEISSAEKNLIEVNGHEFLDFRYEIHPKKIINYLIRNIRM